MPAAIAIPAIVGALGVGASAYGTKKQSDAQKQARDDQMKANQQAMNYERNKQRSAWTRYKSDYDQWYSRYGDKGVGRYGTPSGIDLSKYAKPGDATAGGTAPAGPVTLAGGRQVPGGDYEEYVRQREARRAGGPTVGGLLGTSRSGIQT